MDASPGSARQDDERARLIGAAWAILQRTGFSGLKVQRVAAEAGVSTRGFYRHFADKDQLLLVLVADEVERAAVRLERAVARAGGPEARVRAWITAVIGAAADPIRVDRAQLFTELAPSLRRHHGSSSDGERLWRPLREAIAAGQASGCFGGDDADTDAELVYELTGARLRSALVADRTQPIDETIDVTVDFVLRALSNAPGGPS